MVCYITPNKLLVRRSGNFYIIGTNSVNTTWIFVNIIENKKRPVILGHKQTKISS